MSYFNNYVSAKEYEILSRTDTPHEMMLRDWPFSVIFTFWLYNKKYIGECQTKENILIYKEGKGGDGGDSWHLEI